MFFNELDLLEIRLNELYEVIDKFVLVEARLTHTGLKKPLYFNENKNRFKRFLPKIIHIIIDDYNEISLLHPFPNNYLPGDIEAAINEHIHRNSIIKGLTYADKHDIILLSDVDEIPRARKITQMSLIIKGTAVYGFEQSMHYYYFNLKSKETWIGTKATLFRNISYFHDLRETDKFIRLKNAGWHFSYLGGFKKILDKLRAHVHQEYNKPNLIKRMPFYINNQLDIFERPVRYYPVPLKMLPAYIKSNINKYSQHFIRREIPDKNASMLIDEIISLRREIFRLKRVEEFYKRIMHSHLYPIIRIYSHMKNIFLKKDMFHI